MDFEHKMFYNFPPVPPANFENLFSNYNFKIKPRMKKLILKLFLGFFLFICIAFIILIFTLHISEEAVSWFFFFICAYPLICVSLYAINNLQVFHCQKEFYIQVLAR